MTSSSKLDGSWIGCSTTAVYFLYKNKLVLLRGHKSMQAVAKAWERELDALHDQFGCLFKPPEPRQRSLAYMKGLLGAVELKIGW